MLAILSVYRVVGGVLHCLGEVKSEMTEQCSSNEVVSQYELYLINPLVELTRSFVVAECMMSEQDKHYFAVTDHLSYRTAPSLTVVFCSLVALAIVRCMLILSGH